MIKYWSLSHFKSVQDETELDLAPLTIFAGANSAGKSTIIQSMLLTAQTIQNPVINRPVVLNGHMARLGAFTDIVSNANEKSEISIGFGLEFPKIEDRKGRPRFINRIPRFFYHDLDAEEDFSVNCKYSFSIKGEKSEKEILKLQPLLEKTEIDVKASINKKLNKHHICVKRAKHELKERLKELNLDQENLVNPEINSLQYEVESIAPTSYRRLSAKKLQKKNIAGSTLRHFLPSRVSVVYDSVETEVHQILDFLTLSNSWRDYYAEDEANFLNDKVREIIVEIYQSIQENQDSEKNTRLNRLLSSLDEDFTFQQVMKVFRMIPPSMKDKVAELVEERKNELSEAITDGRPPNYTIRFLTLPDLVMGGVEATHNYFSQSVKYLGPLRDEPKPVYPLSGATDPMDIGFRGEYTAAVLDIHKNTSIEYIPSKHFKSDSQTTKAKTEKLSNAVKDWLNYMGVGSEIKTEDRGKLGHELKISSLDSETFHDLTQVGVGVSQVLPILVLSLLSEKGATIIFEQPELHLHPRVQTRLADFFVSMTKLGKQCIVETHSEYMINRLRYRSAISEGKDIADSVILYFVEKKEGQSDYRKIKINEFGVIEDWPKGFFDENEEIASEILKAGMQKRKKSSDKK